MGEYLEAATTGELEDGAMKKLTLRGREILLARAGGSYYAAENRCPHLGGDLSAGRLEGTVVTCPKHASRFDLKDGGVTRWLKGAGIVFSIVKTVRPPRPLRTYPVKVEGGVISIEI